MFYDVLRIFTLLLLEKMPFPGTSGSKPSQKLKVQGLLLACQEDVLRLVDFGHKIRAACSQATCRVMFFRGSGGWIHSYECPVFQIACYRHPALATSLALSLAVYHVPQLSLVSRLVSSILL